MRVTTVLALAAGAVLLALCWAAPATAGRGNPHGFGIYSPVEPPVRGRPRLHSYDKRSWYYRAAPLLSLLRIGLLGAARRDALSLPLQVHRSPVRVLPRLGLWRLPDPEPLPSR